jgi:transcriptional regulator with XRE-family HTH domain
MATIDRLYIRGTRLGTRSLQQLGDEFRERRLAIGLSQASVGTAIGVSRSVYSRIENGKLTALGIVRAAQLGAVLGLDVSVRAFPGPAHIRDAGSQRRLEHVLAQIMPPLSGATEVPLPQLPDRATELRAWDLIVSGDGKRTAMELEMRLRDVQAVERRVGLKLRDDRVDGFVLLVADTRTNRAVLNSHRDLLGLPRLTPAILFRALRSGRHPPSGIVLI